MDLGVAYNEDTAGTVDFAGANYTQVQIEYQNGQEPEAH